MSPPRRSQRLLPRETRLAKLSDFDYPGPKHSSTTTTCIRKSRRNPRTKPRRSPTAAQLNLENISRSSLVFPSRATKPNVCRPPLSPTHKSSFQPLPVDDLPTKSHALPSSPVSSQDCDDVASPPSDPVQTPANFSLACQPDGPVLGREEESLQLSHHLSSALQSGTSSLGIYVCGTPGTGKTYTVSKVAKRLRSALSNIPSETKEHCMDDHQGSLVCSDQKSFSEIWVNCANLNQPKDLFAHLADQLGLSPHPQNPREAIRQYASSSGPKALVILDEVDFLTSRDQMVLYAAFEWPWITNSRIVVVGIANSIDLPVRLLPWLRQAGCMPEIVSFRPYKATALQTIVQQRIQDMNSSGLTAVAISFAAKKVAAGSGDARLMLDVCHEAQNEMQRSRSETSCIGVVSSIISRRGGLSAAVETIRQLPTQQQLALCVAANAVFYSNRTSPGIGKVRKKATLGGLYDSFVRMCERAHVSVLSFPEFADICCNALIHHGLVDVSATGRGKAGKTLRGRSIRLRVPIEDVRAGVANKGFLPMLIVG